MNDTKDTKGYKAAIKSAANVYALSLKRLYGNGWDMLSPSAQDGAVALQVLSNAMGQVKGEVDVEYLRDMYAAVNMAMGR